MRTRILSDYTVIRLNRDPSISSISIQEASERFRIPDLELRIAEHFYSTQDAHETQHKAIEHFSRYHNNDIERIRATLPFSALKVWFSIRVQNKSVIDIGKVNSAQCLYAQPPSAPTAESSSYKLGRCDTALFVNNLSEEFIGKTDLKGTSQLLDYLRVCLQNPQLTPSASFD
jgi:hypothetical protein